MRSQNFALEGDVLIRGATTNGLVAAKGVFIIEGDLTLGNANAICFYKKNPFALDLLVKKLVVNVTTGGGTVGSHLDAGLADAAAGTNRGTELFNDLLLNNTGIKDSWVAGDGGTQTKWVVWKAAGNATDSFLCGQILDANAASLVGKWYAEVCVK